MTNRTKKAWRLHGVCDLAKSILPLRLDEIPVPEPSANELSIKVSCCAICHTELDEIEGRTSPPCYPVIAAIFKVYASLNAAFFLSINILVCFWSQG